MDQAKGSTGDATPDTIGEYRYEYTLTIDKADIWFSRIACARPYVSFHWQDSYEILYNLQGEQTVHLENRSVILAEDDCVILNPGVLHAARSSADNQFLLAMLPVAFVRKYAPTDASLRFELFVHSQEPEIQEKQRELKSVLQEMDRLSMERSYGYQLRFNAQVFELLYLLCRNFSIAVPGSERKLSAKSKNALADIINYVHEHYASNISIEEAAAVCHFQPQYFCRFFRRNMGKTFGDFVNQTRMYHTYVEMVKTARPIGEIAAQNGFSSYDIFLKYFRAKFGCTPSEFRAMPKSEAAALYQRQCMDL